MKHVQKYRTHLSVYMVIILIAMGGAYLINYQLIGFHWIIATLTLLIIAGIIRIYSIALGYYKYIKQLEGQRQKEAEQDITIDDIMNQENTEKQEEKEQQEEELEKLINQLSQEKDPEKLAQKLLTQLGNELHIVQGIIYQYKTATEKYEILSTYAYYGEDPPQPFELGEGLSGQVARDKKRILLRELPEEYTEVISGLGKRKPKLLLLAPLIHEDKTVALAELSFFEDISDQKIDKFEGILNKLSKHFA